MLEVLDKPSASEMRDELLRAHYRMQHGIFVSQIHEDGPWLSALSRIAPSPMWNHIALCGESAGLQSLEKQLEGFKALDRRPVIYLSEDAAGGVASELAAAGFERFDAEAWMIHSGEALPATEGALRIVEVGERELSAFVDVFYQSFNIADNGYAAALRQSTGRGNPRVRNYVAFDGIKAVGCGTLIELDGIGCIYNVGTIPRYRGRGCAGQMMAHIIAQAAELRTIFLQVERNAPAERLYRKLGFREAFARVGYRLKNWSPAHASSSTVPQRPALSVLLGGSHAIPGEAVSYARESAVLPEITAQQLKMRAAQLQAPPHLLVAAAWACLWMRYSGEGQCEFAVEGNNGEPALLQLAISGSQQAGELAELLIAQLRAAKPASIASAEMLIGSTATSGHVAPLEIRYRTDSSAGLEFAYRSQLYDKDDIRRLGRHLVRVIETIVHDPDAQLSAIDFLGEAERQQLLVDWNYPGPDLFNGPSIVQMFERQVERTPHAPAVMLAAPGQMDNAETLNYRQLNRRANQLAHYLRKHGCGPETMVGICLERSINMIVSLLAVFKCGGAAVPLDPAYPEERLAYMVSDTKAPVILTQEKLAWLFAHQHTRIVRLDTDAELIASESEKNPPTKHTLENAAYVIYTSGSTGAPKGVVIPRLAIAAHCRDAHNFYGLSVHDKVLQFSSFNFDAAMEQILPTLTIGATLVLRDNEIWNIRQFAECLSKIGLTVADIPTAYWAQLAHEWSERPEEVPPNRLRLVIVGGEALPPAALARWHQSPLGQVRLVNAYGPTETTITATACDVPFRAPGDQTAVKVTIGKPRGGREVYVLDKWMNPAPINVPGELHIGGKMLARGYLNRPELTEQKFIQNPFSDDPSARLYKTGDLVRYLPDGNIEFLGRLDDQVKIRGFRIELGEIETVLQQHPQVREAAVLAREDKPGEKRLVAYCVADSKLKPGEVRRYVSSKLPEYMTPAAVVMLESFPLLPSGKVNRRALPAPAPEEAEASHSFKGPEDPLELQLQLVFERTLKRVGIGVDVSFFELGGDSLQALELLVEVEKATGRSLPLGTLYQSSTIQALAQVIRQQPENGEFKCLVPLQANGAKPPLYFVHTTPGDVLGYGRLIYHLGTDQPCYGIQSLGLGDPAKRQTSIEEMAELYVGLIKEHQPRGPYYLAGWCYGGILAVEIARLLRQSGDKVALLALFETVAMRPGWTNIRYYLHRLRCMLAMSADRWAAYVREKLRYRRESVIANRMRFRQIEKRPDEDPVAAEQTERRLAHLECVYNTNLAALDNYRPRYYPGTVTLFNAHEQDPALIPDPDYGWVGLAKAIEIYDVPGNHDSMLAEPNVSGLATKLKDALAKAQATPSIDPATT